MSFRRALALSLPALTALSLAACSDDPAGPELTLDACTDAGVTGTEWAGDARLDVGEGLLLAPGASLCLVLPDADTREYALAYLDTRAIDASRTARELPLDTFEVTVRDLEGPASALTRLRPPSAPAWAEILEAPDYLPTVATAPTPNAPALRDRPWTANESFVFYDRLRDADRPARVLRVYDDWLVFAALEGTPDAVAAGMAARMDTAFARFREHGLPALRALFVQTLPTTSAGSGQLLVLADPILQGASGIAAGETAGGEAYSWIALLASASWTATGLAGLVQHEVAHTFQRQYIHSTRLPGAPVVPASGAARWGVEGGASVAQVEMMRRWGGIAPLSNFDWRAASPQAEVRYYGLFAAPGGSLTDGYGPAASFILDLAARRAKRGEGYEAALSAVLRGSIEGWYGHGWDTRVRDGLVARMRARFGDGWDPAEGLLTWMLSQAVDDRTESGTFQDFNYLDVSEPGPGTGRGWFPDAEVAMGEGGRFEVRRAYGSPGFFRITGGGALHLSGGVAGVRWMIVRSK